MEMALITPTFDQQTFLRWCRNNHFLSSDQAQYVKRLLEGGQYPQGGVLQREMNALRDKYLQQYLKNRR